MKKKIKEAGLDTCVEEKNKKKKKEKRKTRNETCMDENEMKGRKII